MLSRRLIAGTTDRTTRGLIDAWLLGGATVASDCIGRPGPLKIAWGKGHPRTLTALVLEFTFPMMFRWFRHIKGAQAGSPGSRLRTRSAWIRRVNTLFWDGDIERRVAICTRLDALFSNDYEANLEARVSPSVLGLVPANSLSSAEAAHLLRTSSRDLSPSRRSASKLWMGVIKGGVSISESFMLGVRVLGLCGHLRRLHPRWNELAFTPLRPSRELVGIIPPRVWSLSAATGLARLLDAGAEATFGRLADTGPDEDLAYPPFPR